MSINNFIDSKVIIFIMSIVIFVHYIMDDNYHKLVLKY